MRKIAVLVTGLMVLASCASTGKTTTSQAQQEPTQATVAPDEAQQEEGFLRGYYGRMEPGPEGGAKYRWLNPKTNFAKYDKVMLDNVTFFFADDSQYKGIDGNEMKELSDKFNLEMVNALKDRYPIVTEPGPDVVRLRVAITHLKQSRPALSAVSSVMPIGLGVSTLKKGATGSWTGSGATSAEFLALDTMTNEVVAAAQDEKTAGFTERFSKWGSAEEAFKYWAERIRAFMDSVHQG